MKKQYIRERHNTGDYSSNEKIAELLSEYLIDEISFYIDDCSDTPEHAVLLALEGSGAGPMAWDIVYKVLFKP